MLDIIAFYIEMRKGKQKEWFMQYTLILVRIFTPSATVFSLGSLEAREIWTGNMDN